MSEQKADAVEVVEVTIKVEVNPDWIDLVTKHTDLFHRGYCGYWARAVKRSSSQGWLVYVDQSDNTGCPPTEEAAQAARTAWEAGQTLPEDFYCWDREFAIRAWVEGVKGKRGGVDWYEKGDAGDYDAAIQMALFGKLVFG